MNDNIPDLLTPSVVEIDPHEVGEKLPRWITMAAPVEDDDGVLVAFAVVFGKTHRKSFILTAHQLAFVLELCRSGHTVTTNDNGNGQIYPKVTFRGAPNDNITLSRLLAGLGPNEAAMFGDIKSDLRPGSVHSKGAGKPSKFACTVAFRHARRLIEEKGAQKPLSVGVSVADYMDNLEALWAEIEPPKTNSLV